MGVHFWDNGHIGQCDKVCTGSTRNNQDASEINSTEEVYMIIHKYSNASLYILVHIDFGEIHVSIYYMIYS